MSTKPYSWEVEPRDRLVPFGAGDVLWVTSVEYPPSIGSGSGFEFWVQESPLPAPSPGLWFVDGWELAALTRAPVRRRRVCVPAATPRTGWREQPPASDAGAAGGWAGPTRELPIVTRGEWMRRGVVGGDPRPLMTRLAARRTTLVAGGRPAGREACRANRHRRCIARGVRGGVPGLEGLLMAPVAVTRAEFGDVARLARVVAVAVFDLPVSGFLIPDEDDRRRVSAEVARLVYLWPALAGGVLWCTADRMAVAGWLRHNPGRVAEPHPQAAVELRRLVGRWYPRFERLAELLHEVHAPLLGLPHDRLAVLAVHPDRQCRGGGTALLAAYHEYLDGIGRPACLDAAGPELVGFYRRFGYAEIGDPVRLPNRATLHPMWRPPTTHPDDAAPVDVDGRER